MRAFQFVKKMLILIVFLCCVKVLKKISYPLQLYRFHCFIKVFQFCIICRLTLYNVPENKEIKFTIQYLQFHIKIL